MFLSYLLILTITLLFFNQVHSVEKRLIFDCSSLIFVSKFFTCDQLSFCRRHKAFTKGLLDYSIQVSSITFKDSHLSAVIHESKTNTDYTLDVILYNDEVVRIKINEKDPMKERHEANEVLENLLESKFTYYDNTNHILQINDKFQIFIYPTETKFDIKVNSQTVVSINKRGLFYFEYLRNKEIELSTNNQDDPYVSVLGSLVGDIVGSNNDVPKGKNHVDIPGISMENAWEETIGSEQDTRKFGI